MTLRRSGILAQRKPGLRYDLRLTPASAAFFVASRPDGPGALGQSWKKPLLTVMALPVASFATFCPVTFLPFTRTKNASLKGLFQYSLNSLEKKAKSKDIACAFEGTR